MLILILFCAIGSVLTGMSGTEIGSTCWIVLFVECRFWTSERSTARRVTTVSAIGAAMVAGVLDAPSCIFEIVIVIICGEGGTELEGNCDLWSPVLPSK